MIGGRTRVFGLIGHPVAATRSPALHNGWFAKYAIDAVYVAFDVDPVHGGDVVAAARTLRLAGANVTVPFKEAVLPGLDRLDAAADRAAAANVLVNTSRGWVGHNTDGEGWVRAFEGPFGPIAGRRVAVLGAGGSGRAIAAACVDHHAERVVLLNRDVGRAQAAAHRIGRCEAGALADFGAYDVDVVVSAVSAAGYPAIEALQVDHLPGHAVWSDLHYHDPNPPRVAACRARGLRVQDGFPMLVHQAALAFAHFTGRDVAADDVAAHLR